MSNVAIVTMLPYLSNIFKDIKNIELMSKLMITLPSLAIAIFAPLLGHFVYKFGKKNSAIVAILAFSLFGTAGFYLNTIYEILASRFLFGVSVAVLMIVMTSLTGDYFKDEDRHKFIGLQSVFIAVGGVVFIVGGGYLSDINWRYPFIVYGFGLIILIFVLKYLHKYSENTTNEEDGEHLLNHNLWYIYLLAFCFMSVFYILPTQMPFLMMNVLKASGTLTGVIIATAFIFNALGALSFAKLKKHFKFSQIYLIGMFVLAIGFILIGNITNKGDR